MSPIVSDLPQVRREEQAQEYENGRGHVVEVEELDSCRYRAGKQNLPWVLTRVIIGSTWIVGSSERRFGQVLTIARKRGAVMLVFS